ncbi:FecCD family ABC transporter permease [Gorillibacterium timonense]|uniref:FecCD family ABC transporter permease n=1 Tax=Gorillibacterium timonense TaxID=1689269 RepID=UPI00071C7916|nr:iron ABC transporter permease [Gorillibacterium timonense]
MRKSWVYGGGFGLLLLVSVVICLSVGSAHVPLAEVWGILLHRIPGIGPKLVSAPDPAFATIVADVRLPRVALAMLVGASLAVAGAGFQAVLRNPLADPYTLGVASGASAGAAFAILSGMRLALGMWSVPGAAFLMGLLTLLLVYTLAGRGGRRNIETLILAGVIVQAFFGAFVSLMISLSHGVVNEIVFWLMGSVALRGWEYSGLLLPLLIGVLAILIAYSRQLNLFALGERHASHMGANVNRTKLIVLGASTLLTAGAVSVAGTIGFVGLVVPHLVRLLAGPDNRLLIPVSALAGASYVLWADTLARLALGNQEIPLGVVTALIGTPFFAYLLLKRKRTAEG